MKFHGMIFIFKYLLFTGPGSPTGASDDGTRETRKCPAGGPPSSPPLYHGLLPGQAPGELALHQGATPHPDQAHTPRLRL